MKWRRKLCLELSAYDSKTSHKLIRLLECEQEEIAIGNVLGNKQVTLKISTMNHIYNSGHITGIDKRGVFVGNELSAKDLIEIKDVIEMPDLVIRTRPNDRNGNRRVKLEKQMVKRHRLILEITDKGEISVVTYFNIKNKLPPEG